MERTVDAPAVRLESGTPLRVWYGVAAAPFAWVTQASLLWWLASRACAGHQASGAARILLASVSAVAFAAGSAALAVSMREWRGMRPERPLNRATAAGTAEYLVMAGILISVVFVLAIAWTTLPALVFDVCEGTR